MLLKTSIFAGPMKKNMWIIKKEYMATKLDIKALFVPVIHNDKNSKR